ncbi:MAG: hypothetical protein ACM3OO_01945 [Planctomycetaceae bacterium]
MDEIVLGPFRDALRTAVASETRAYGFTLLVWSTGALSVAQEGLPTVAQVFAFLLGALLAMALVVLVAFGGPMRRWTTSREPHYAFGAIHIGSVAVGTTCGWIVCLALSARMAFAGAAFTAVLVYQLLLGLEVAVSSARGRRAATP